MANYVKFQRGSEQAYKKLSIKNQDTLYFVYDPVDSAKAKLYLGDKLLSGVGEGTGVTSLAELKEVVINGVPSAGSFLVCNSEGKWVNTSLEDVIALIGAEPSLNIKVDTKAFTFNPTEVDGSNRLELKGFSAAENGTIAFKGTDGTLNWGTPQIITNITGRLEDAEEELNNFTSNLESIVQEKIAGLNHLTFQKVDDLSQAVNNNTVYLIPNPSVTVKNEYLEYLVLDGKPELLGNLNTGEVSLDNYATIEALQSVASNLNTVSEKVGTLETNYAAINEKVLGLNAVVGDITQLNNYNAEAPQTIIEELNNINERLRWEEIPE